METPDKHVQVDVNLSLFERVIDGLLSVVRPVFNVIAEVSAAGWLGAAIFFMIFFMIYLIKAGASTANIKAFGSAIEYIGKFGFLMSILYVAVFILELIALPPAAAIFYVTYNSIVGERPGISDLITLISHGSPYKAAVFSDFTDFYFSDRTFLLPLGLRAAGFVTLAFGAMIIVGTAILNFSGKLPDQK